jgi:hypothetical protein
MRLLYHVTSWDRLPLIIQEGIVHQKDTAHPGKFDQDVRTIEGAVFAFDNAEDAAHWAFRWSWDGKQTCAIIRFVATGRWLKDKHWEAGFAKGTWLASKKPVAPEKIDTIVKFNHNRVRSFDDGLNYLDGPLKDWIEEGRANA